MYGPCYDDILTVLVESAEGYKSSHIQSPEDKTGVLMFSPHIPVSMREGSRATRIFIDFSVEIKEKSPEKE